MGGRAGRAAAASTAPIHGRTADLPMVFPLNVTPSPFDGHSDQHITTTFKPVRPRAGTPRRIAASLLPRTILEARTRPTSTPTVFRLIEWGTLAAELVGSSSVPAHMLAHALAPDGFACIATACRAQRAASCRRRRARNSPTRCWRELRG